MFRHAITVCLCALAACAGDLSFSGYSMGASYSLRGRGCRDQSAAVRRVEEAFYSVDSTMSNWSSESEVSRFNLLQPGDSMPVSEGMREVLVESLRVHAGTEGLFDPSIGGLIEAWGFGVQARSAPPTTSEIESARANSGMDGVHLKGSTLSRGRPIHLNLSGIAEGYAVDQAAKAVSRHCEEFFVEAGGEMRIKGSWEIGIQHPGHPGLVARMVLKNLAASTSGTYANWKESQGKRYAHIIDPRSGYPARVAVSVTVIGENCATADALSTGLILADEVQMKRILGRFPGYGAVAVFEKNAGYEMRILGTVPELQCERPAEMATDRATAAASGTTTLFPNCL